MSITPIVDGNRFDERLTPDAADRERGMPSENRSPLIGLV
jgi:hypothetical protein